MALHAVLIAVALAFFAWRFSGNVEVVALSDQHLLLVKLFNSQADFVVAGGMAGFRMPFNAYYALGEWLLDSYDYQSLAKAGFLAVGALVLAAVYALAWAITRSSIAAFSSAFLLFDAEAMAWPHVGANGLPSVGLYAYWPAFALDMFALAALAKRRTYLFSGLAVAACAIHPPQGALALLMLTPAAWLQSGRDRRYFAIHLGLCGLTAVLLAATAGQVAVPMAAADQESLLLILRLFTSGHVFLNAGVSGWWTPFLCFMMVVAAGTALAIVWREHLLLLRPTFVTGGVLFLISVAAVYVFPVGALLQLMPIRLSTLLASVALIAGLCWSWQSVCGARHVMSGILGAAAIAGAAAATPLGIAIFSVAVCSAAALSTSARARSVAAMLGLATVGLAAMGAAFSTMPSFTYDIVQARHGAALAIFAVLAAIVIVRLTQRGADLARWLGPGFLALMVLALAWSPAQIDYSRNREWRARLDEFWLLGRWLRENTPSGKPLLSAPFYDMPLFELSARRGSPFQTGKIAWTYSSPALASRISTSWLAIGVDFRRYDNHAAALQAATSAWRSLPPSRIVELASERDASCVITDADHPLPFRPLWRGRYFQVYDVRTNT